MRKASAGGDVGDSSAVAADFADFDEVVESLTTWAGSGPDWLPARRVRAD